MKVRKYFDDGQFDYAILCPACGCAHALRVGRKEGPNWTFNGDMNKPTFAPSLRVSSGLDGRDVCHSQITDGMIMFYPDSTHSMAGQTVPLPIF